MQREIIRVEPIDSNFEKWGAPVSTCTRAGNMVFVSGMPPFDPETGEILVHAPFERQVELIAWEFPRLCRGGSRSLTYTAVGDPGNLRWLTRENTCGAPRPSIKLKQNTGMANTIPRFESGSRGFE